MIVSVLLEVIISAYGGALQASLECGLQVGEIRHSGICSGCASHHIAEYGIIYAY